MKELLFKVVVEWDEQVKVWFVSETDVPGLNAEAKTLDEMSKELRSLIPELLVLNGVFEDLVDDEYEVPWELISRHQEKIQAFC